MNATTARRHFTACLVRANDRSATPAARYDAVQAGRAVAYTGLPAGNYGEKAERAYIDLDNAVNDLRSDDYLAAPVEATLPNVNLYDASEDQLAAALAHAKKLASKKAATTEEETTTTTAALTPASLALFQALVEDAPNWGGMPLVDVSTAEKGNLTHLKRAGLLTTTTSDGDAFAIFTPAGEALAATFTTTTTTEDTTMNADTTTATETTDTTEAPVAAVATRQASNRRKEAAKKPAAKKAPVKKAAPVEAAPAVELLPLLLADLAGRGLKVTVAWAKSGGYARLLVDGKNVSYVDAQTRKGIKVTPAPFKVAVQVATPAEVEAAADKIAQAAAAQATARQEKAAAATAAKAAAKAAKKAPAKKAS